MAAFVVLILGVTAALPAHMVSMLREQGLAATWVIAVPALIGALQAGVLRRERPGSPKTFFSSAGNSCTS